LTARQRGPISPAWYIIRSNAWWARWLNILHLPYTGWHLSYVVVGASLSDQLDLQVLVWALIAFFLGMGVAGHAFDLVKDDPLRLGLGRRPLIVAGAVSLALAVAIGAYFIATGRVTPWLVVCLPLGALLAAGYGLEWRYLHGNWQFALWWAAFPLLVSYFSQTTAWSWALLPAAAFAIGSAQVQRLLSTRSRFLRRRVSAITISIAEGTSGDTYSLGREWLLRNYDAALAGLSLVMLALALVLLVQNLGQNSG
jgi:hypothetical protein